jgi:scyllo-inositol 2-dehydrogenase (NADP+)
MNVGKHKRSNPKLKRRLPLRVAVASAGAADRLTLPIQPTPVADALRVGLCGLGRGAFGMLQRDLLTQPVARIVACTDLLAERTRDLAAKLNARPVGSFEALLAEKDVELVVISTRSHEHAAMAAKALRAGKHVLLEKPAAVTLAETDKLLDLARQLQRRRSVRLFIRHNRRFDAPFQLARHVIKSGKIGSLFAFSLRVHSYNPRRDWQSFRRFGGGQLLNWGSHVIDWAIQLLGSPVVDVWSDCRRIVSGGDAEDHVKVMLRAKNGTVADLEISSAAAIAAPTWHLLGTRGALIIDGNGARLRYLAEMPAAHIKADAHTPPQWASYSNPVSMSWIEETPAVVRQEPVTFWGSLYAALRRGQEFPITMAEVREIARIVDLARDGGTRRRQAAKNRKRR